jgi:hypothetical protein
MSKVVATLHGPNYFTPNHDFGSIEVHASVQAAAESLLYRRQTHGARPATVEFLDGTIRTDYYPTMEGCYLKVWRPYWNEDRDVFAQEAHTLIHNTDRADYYVYLVEHSGGRYQIETTPKEGTR